MSQRTRKNLLALLAVAGLSLAVCPPVRGEESQGFVAWWLQWATDLQACVGSACGQQGCAATTQPCSDHCRSMRCATGGCPVADCTDHCRASRCHSEACTNGTCPTEACTSQPCTKGSCPAGECRTSCGLGSCRPASDCSECPKNCRPATSCGDCSKGCCPKTSCGDCSKGCCPKTSCGDCSKGCCPKTSCGDCSKGCCSKTSCGDCTKGCCAKSCGDCAKGCCATGTCGRVCGQGKCSDCPHAESTRRPMMRFLRQCEDGHECHVNVASRMTRMTREQWHVFASTVAEKMHTKSQEHRQDMDRVIREQSAQIQQMAEKMNMLVNQISGLQQQVQMLNNAHAYPYPYPNGYPYPQYYPYNAPTPYMPTPVSPGTSYPPAPVQVMPVVVPMPATQTPVTPTTSSNWQSQPAPIDSNGATRTGTLAPVSATTLETDQVFSFGLGMSR